ncbi:MAG TPA: hypothetical protein VND89_03080 [Acidimicrobiales bacterium]|nr:hypothetical protein [Acidimicrobiales bacterium]
MKKILVVATLAASLGLASCGVTASLNQAVSSLGASSNMQIHLTAKASGSQSSKVEKILRHLSFEMNYSNPSGAPLSQVTNKVNVELMVSVGLHQLVDVRVVGENVYVLVNASAMSNIPGANVSPAELSAVQLLLGRRWFEIPKSLLETYAANEKALPTSATVAAAAKDQAIEKQIIDALTGVIESTPYKKLAGGGYAQTGTLESIAKAELPIIKSFSGTTSLPATVKGSYSIAFTMSGSTATGGSIGITAPNGTKGNSTVTLNATLAHANDTIVAPTNVTVITPAVLSGLLAQAK